MKTQEQPDIELNEVTRFEVIDRTGRILVIDPRVDPNRFKGAILSLQDEGKTLKVFLKEPTDA